jgi:heptosyltransferase-2
MRVGVLNDRRTLDKQALPLMVQRFVALAHPATVTAPPDFPQPALRANLKVVPVLLERHTLSLEKPVVVFCPGAEYGPSKQWPVAYFAQLAKNCLQQGRQVWITGSGKDEPVAREILSLAGNVPGIYNLAGMTSLGEVIDLMSQAESVVTNDSGLMHIAAALSIPLLAIYGSTSPEFTPPLGKSVKILSSSLDCSPCFARECPLQHHNCMKNMTPELVIQALQELEDAAPEHLSSP